MFGNSICFAKVSAALIFPPLSNATGDMADDGGSHLTVYAFGSRFGMMTPNSLKIQQCGVPQFSEARFLSTILKPPNDIKATHMYNLQ